MSHATLVSDGLLGLTITLAVLLVMFVAAAIGTPAEAAVPSARPDAEPPGQPAAEPPVPVLPRRRPASPPAPGGTGYLPRHAAAAAAAAAHAAAAAGGPPWGPAPRPPGMDRE